MEIQRWVSRVALAVYFSNCSGSFFVELVSGECEMLPGVLDRSCRSVVGLYGLVARGLNFQVAKVMRKERNWEMRHYPSAR
jgi:hypothetical protein